MKYDPWDYVWGEVLFKKYAAMLAYCNGDEFDADGFAEQMSQFEHLYGKADIAIQGAYHEMVVDRIQHD